MKKVEPPQTTLYIERVPGTPADLVAYREGGSREQFLPVLPFQLKGCGPTLHYEFLQEREE